MGKVKSPHSFPELTGPPESITLLLLPGKSCKMSKCSGKRKDWSTMRHTLYHSDFSKATAKFSLRGGKNGHTPLFKKTLLWTKTLDGTPVLARVSPPPASICGGLGLRFLLHVFVPHVLNDSLGNAQRLLGGCGTKPTDWGDSSEEPCKPNQSLPPAVVQ